MPRKYLPGSLERKILGLRLEQAVYGLLEILSLVVDQGDLESEAFLYELLQKLWATSDWIESSGILYALH